MEPKQDLYPQDWNSERADSAATKNDKNEPARRRRKEHSVSPALPTRSQRS